jgi:HEAT repeat protein
MQRRAFPWAAIFVFMAVFLGPRLFPAEAGETTVSAQVRRLIDRRDELDRKAEEARTWDGPKLREPLSALIKLGKPAIPALLVVLHDAERRGQSRAYAAEVLGCIGDPEVVPDLVATLQDKSAWARAAAAEALGRMKTEPQLVVPALIPLLQDKVSTVRKGAACALAKYGPAAGEAVLALVQLLDDDYSDARWAGALALRSVGTPAKVAAPKLICLLKDKDSEVRRFAAYALGVLGAGTKDTVPALLAALDATDPRESGDPQQAIIYALEALSTEAGAAAPALVKILGDSSGKSWTRDSTVKALAAIGPPSIPPLAKLVDEGKDEMRYFAIQCLGMIGPPSAPVLSKMLQNNDWCIRLHAAKALGEIGPAARDAVPALTQALEDKLQNPPLEMRWPPLSERTYQAIKLALRKITPDE